uniref:C2H2-type domain-containing protein n=1 Tax=Meloidogyne incognita TaxID=6306 RepID=A0A914LCW2_MELIC
MSVLDLYFKEIAYGQKIVYEETLMQQQQYLCNNIIQQQHLINNNNVFRPQQQQQNIQQNFQHSSFPNNIATNNNIHSFPTSNSAFSSLPPNNLFSTTSNKSQNFSQTQNYSSHFKQQCPPPQPPTMFDPFTAAAANFMQHFTQNTNQQVQSTPSALFNTQHNNSLQFQPTREVLPMNFNNFVFSQFGADFSPSPSHVSLNSAGISAVDSSSSSGIPSSPDDSSCSLDAEILILKEFRKNKEDFQSKHGMGEWQSVNSKEIFPDEQEHLENLKEKTETRINENTSTTQPEQSCFSSSNSSNSQEQEIIIIEYDKNELDNTIEFIKEDKKEAEKEEEKRTIQNEIEIFPVEDVENLTENTKITEINEEKEEDNTSTSSLDFLCSSNNNDSSTPLEEEEEIEINKYEESIISSCDDSQINLDKKEDLINEEDINQSDQQNLHKLKNGKVPCRWVNCKEMFCDEDGLYDHLISAHIDTLTKWVLAEQREIEKQQKSGGIKRRRCGSFISIENTKERFRCQWRKCEQFPRRGDAQKKLDWLLNHLVVRHAPKSRPHKCLFEGCSLRFSKVGTLRDHIRCAHNDNNNKQNGKKLLEENNVKISCFEFRPLVHFPSVSDCIDSRTIDWARNEMLKTKNIKNQQQSTFKTSKVRARILRDRRRIVKTKEENIKIKTEQVSNIVEKVREKQVGIN